MCIRVYLGSNNPLKIIPFNISKPHFHVELIDSSCEESKQVSGKLDTPYIYRLGSHMGCSCGFSYFKEHDYGISALEIQNRHESIQALKDYLTESLKTAKLKICTWEKDRRIPVIEENVKPINPQQIDIDSFEFKEDEILILNKTHQKVS